MMPDREKVIEEIEDALSGNLAKVGNVYRMSLNGLKDKALTDVLALLKEQEAVEPEKFMDGQVERYKCRKCGKHLLYASFAKDNYCSKCGQAVKWE